MGDTFKNPRIADLEEVLRAHARSVIVPVRLSGEDVFELPEDMWILRDFYDVVGFPMEFSWAQQADSDCKFSEVSFLLEERDEDDDSYKRSVSFSSNSEDCDHKPLGDDPITRYFFQTLGIYHSEVEVEVHVHYTPGASVREVPMNKILLAEVSGKGENARNILKNFNPRGPVEKIVNEERLFTYKMILQPTFPIDPMNFRLYKDELYAAINDALREIEDLPTTRHEISRLPR